MGTRYSVPTSATMDDANWSPLDQKTTGTHAHPHTDAYVSSSHNQHHPTTANFDANGGDTDDASTPANQLQRRVSPRLHQSSTPNQMSSTPTLNGHVENSVSNGVPTPKTVNGHVENSVSNGVPTPKMVNGHVKNSVSNGVPTPKTSSTPIVNGNAENSVSNGIPTPKTSSVDSTTPCNQQLQRRLSPRLLYSQSKPTSGRISNGEVQQRSQTVTNDVTPAKRSAANVISSPASSKTSRHNGGGAIKSGQSSSQVVRKGGVYSQVKKTLTLYNAYYLQFLKEEEERRKATGSKRYGVMRPESQAVEKMKIRKEILYPHKQIGHIPGIHVGFKFFSHYEMAAVGFHSDWSKGIDIIRESDGKKGEYKDYKLPIAISIVVAGQYDKYNTEEIVYIGHGAKNVVGSKFEREDKFLHGYNLAMESSRLQSVPIRVIFGLKDKESYSEMSYTYGGLYKVVATLCDIGHRGYLYQFRLQPFAAAKQQFSEKVRFVRADSPKTWSADLPGLICADLSNGIERFCIPVTNLCDDATIDSEEFTYLEDTRPADSVQLPPSRGGCDCKGRCTNPKTCSCASPTGSNFSYVPHRDGPRLCRPKDVVLECGEGCACGPSCINRASQGGIKHRLEVYRTHNKGWAVRSWDPILSGAFVCEYIGLLRRSDEVDHNIGNEFIFEIDCLHTMNEMEGRERRCGSATAIMPKIEKEKLGDSAEYCIDADSIGNVTKFINHSCEPNLFVQCVLRSHRDPRFARIVLFAANDIPPMQELTYDYGYALDSVVGPDGEVKKLACFCGAPDCRKRLY